MSTQIKKVIHLTYKQDGKHLIACKKGTTQLRSNDTRAVNCTLCKDTDIYKQLHSRHGKK